MGKTISAADVRDLRREIDETKMLVGGILQVIVGVEKTAAFEQRVYWAARDRERERQGSGTPLYTVGLPLTEGRHLYAEDLETLEDIAAKSREDIAAMKGVGPVTMRKLENAMDDHGLTWAEAA